MSLMIRDMLMISDLGPALMIMPRTTTSAAAVPNLWRPYGLRSSPFFQNELRAGDPTHPVSLFVGREEEARRVEVAPAQRFATTPKRSAQS